MKVLNSNPVICVWKSNLLLFLLLPLLLGMAGFAAGGGSQCDCSPSEATEVYAEWEKLRHGISPKEARQLFRSVMKELEKEDKDLQKEVQDIVDSSFPFRLIVKGELYLSLLNRPEMLRAQLIHDIRNDPEWAARVMTFIPRRESTVNKVLAKVIGVRSLAWRRCVGRLAKTFTETLNSVTLEATCRIERNTGEPTHEIEGEVHFSRKLTGGPTTVTLDIRGFNSSEGTEHAFHVHAIGQTGNRCSDAGPHYNPDNKDHGAPTDQHRHVGDLGNVVVDARGRVVKVMDDRLLELSGAKSIVGKSVVIHAGVDDLGRGGFPDSKTTGHAGGRIGCCVIKRL